MTPEDYDNDAYNLYRFHLNAAAEDLLNAAIKAELLLKNLPVSPSRYADLTLAIAKAQGKQEKTS